MNGPTDPHNLLPYWRQAAAHPYGLRLRTPDVRRLTSALYSARASSREAALRAVTLRASPLDPTGEVWLEPGA